MGKARGNKYVKKVKDATDFKKYEKEINNEYSKEVKKKAENLKKVEPFKKYVEERYRNKCYRPQLVLVLYRGGKVLFVKSKSSAWNLPQEGINKNESPENAFIRCWAEEMLNLDVSKLKRIKAWSACMKRIKQKYFPSIQHYRYADMTETPGRSRGEFKDGKVYFYSFAEYQRTEKQDSEVLETCDPEEVVDFEWVDYREARLLMVTSGVNWKKRRITEHVLRMIINEGNLEEICHPTLP